ncbi:MAG: MBL fold metallo-hydrolase [Deltaproteobacteria bacterium]|nr:MBL fold metallo-hydrolase [Deltaproteobacteria bacterium]
MKVSAQNSLRVTLSRLLAGLIGLIFLILGLGFLTLPDIFAMGFSVQPMTIQGLNAIRGNFGGLFLGMSFFCFLGAATKRWSWLIVPMVFLLIIIIGRLISLGLDGFFATGTRIVILEVFLLIVLSVSARVLALKAGTNENGLKVLEIINFKTLIAAVIITCIPVLLILSQKKIGMGLINSLATQAMGSDIMAGWPDGVHVALCGSGSPIADPRRTSACTAVIAGKNLYLVDIGPGSERKLELMRLNPGKVKAVFLTHFHSDHIGDLGELMLKRWSGGSKKNPLDVFGPTGVETVVKGFNQVYSLDTQYRILHHGPETVPPAGAGGLARSFDFREGKDEVVIIAEEGLKITAFKVDHAPVKPAVGYRFDYKGRSVVISGDTVSTPSLFKQARGADLLVMEALQPAMVRILREVGEKIGRTNISKIAGDILNYHASPEDAAKIAARAGARHLLLTHILPPLPVSELKPAFMGEAKKYYKGPITIGEDGLLFSLPAGNKKIMKKWLL